jgi:hypothetical protein
MVSDPTKPRLKNITVNRLPADLVIGVKALAIQLDSNIEDLVECIFKDALKDGEKWFPHVHRLRTAKAKAKAEQKKVNEQLKQIKEKLEEANV